MNTVIVYGPKACGKTTNMEQLRRAFKCERVIDLESTTPGGMRALNAPDDGRRTLILTSREHIKIEDAERYSFAHAMKMHGLKDARRAQS